MTRILSGTAAVLAGVRTVAFTGDPLSDANCPADGTVILGGAAYFIASRTDTSHFDLTRDYEGVDGTVSCEIDPLNANAINLVKVARSITEYNAKLALTDAYGKGLFYESIGLTGANDPGPGRLARNAAAWADSTEIYMDVLDYGGHEQGALIDLAKAGTVYIVRSIDTGAYAAYTLSAAPQNMGPDEWRKISLSYVDGDGLIADGELVAVEWNRKGESFAADAEVDDMAGRAAYDNEAPGFVVKVNDDGTGRAVFFTMGTGGAGAWGSPAYLTGTKGDKGDQGDKGWAPQLVNVSDGTRRVLKLAGYVGGAGAPPTANVGDYLKDDGTFTADIAEAEDFRGAPGLNGTGTVASVEPGDGISIDNSDPTAPIVNAIAFTGDSGSGGTIGGVPAPSAGDAAASKFLKANGLWEPVISGRERLTANRTYYVRADGSDSNNGLSNTAGGAFATIQKAVDVVGALDVSIYDVVIQVGAGTWAPVVLKNFVGAGLATMRGNVASQSTVVIAGGTGSQYALLANQLLSRWRVEGFTFTGGSYATVYVNNFSFLTLGSNSFGATVSYQISVRSASFCYIDTNYSIVGAGTRHWDIINASVLWVQDLITITVSGTPAFSSCFVNANRGSVVIAYSLTWSGSATGDRYRLASNAVIETNGGGAAYFPGSAAGSATTGGQYI